MVHLVKIYWDVHIQVVHRLPVIFQLKAQIKTEEIFSFVFNLIQKNQYQSIFIIKISYVYGWQSLFFFLLYLVKTSYTVLLVLVLIMYYLGVQKSERSLTFQNQIISLIFH